MKHVVQYKDKTCLERIDALSLFRYNAPYKTKIQTWTHNLSVTADILEQWIVVQNLWVYLEAVFVGGDIAKQLPQVGETQQLVEKTELN